jgi:predicted Zn-dependent protease
LLAIIIIHQPMDIAHQRLLVAAQGYSELGLPELALAELDLLPEEVQKSPVTVECRLSVLMQAKRWKVALGIGRVLCELAPDRTTGFIHAAFCLHELGQSREARELLVSGPAALKAEPTYHYNLACYEAALGNLEQARAHLKVSFAMDRKLKDYARTDPDLEVLRSLDGAGN